MPASRTSPLHAQLRRTIRALDAEIKATPLDSKLQRALIRMYVGRNDELGRLLAEVGHKASLLDSARMRAAFLHRYGEPGAATVYASEIHRATSLADQESLTSLDVDLPQPARHGDITIGVTALAESSGRYHLRIRLTSEVPFAGAMPLLARRSRGRPNGQSLLGREWPGDADERGRHIAAHWHAELHVRSWRASYHHHAHHRVRALR